MTKENGKVLVARSTGPMRTVDHGPAGILSGMVTDTLALARRQSCAMPHAAINSKKQEVEVELDEANWLDGVVLADFYIEAGARSFAEYAGCMIDDLGDRVKPYLKSWYVGVKYDPRSFAVAAGMDDAATMETFDFDSLPSRSCVCVEAEKYLKAKQYLLAIFESAHVLGCINVSDLNFRSVIDGLTPLLVEHLDADTMRNMRPYLVRFVREAQTGTVIFNLGKNKNQSDIKKVNAHE